MRLSCEKATLICTKNQYGEATLFEKIQLMIHLFICAICKRYSGQNQTLSSLFKMKSADCKATHKCLSSEEKQALQEELNQHQE